MSLWHGCRSGWPVVNHRDVELNRGRPSPEVVAEGRLGLNIADGFRRRELAIFVDLRQRLIPRLRARLDEHGLRVEQLELPGDARPYPGARFSCPAATASGERLTIHCELRPRRWNGSRVGSVRYAVVRG